MPAKGSDTEVKSVEIGAETWVMATRKMMTSTSLDSTRARTNIAHLLIQPFAASQEEPENANGASAMATRSRALRTSKESHTIAAAAIASPARKMMRTAPTPGAAIVMPPRPATRIEILPPMESTVSPAAWMMPMQS